MTRLALLFSAAALTGCLSGTYIQSRPHFGEPTAVSSPRDEPGSRFDGARLSPGFGILYRNGFTSEIVTQAECGGFLGDTPEHVLELGYAMQLKLTVHADNDVVMKVVAPNGDTTCGRPPSTANENVWFADYLAPGRYEIFVGSTRPHTSSVYRLVMSE
jgi:hypothetical protein